MKYICVNNDNNQASDAMDTLEDAWEDYKSYWGDEPDIDEVSFYEVDAPLIVELKLVRKEVPVKIKAEKIKL